MKLRPQLLRPSQEPSTENTAPNNCDTPRPQEKPTAPVETPVLDVPTVRERISAPRTTVPVKGPGISGVKVTQDPAAAAQLAALKALAASGKVTYGQELKIEVFEPTCAYNGEMVFNTRVSFLFFLIFNFFIFILNLNFFNC